MKLWQNAAAVVVPSFFSRAADRIEPSESFRSLKSLNATRADERWWRSRLKEGNEHNFERRCDIYRLKSQTFDLRLIILEKN